MAMTGACKGLGPSDVTRLTMFMEEVAHAFEIGDPVAIQQLGHPGCDPQGQKNSFDFDQSLIDGGDKVIAWTAKPYKEPKWEIMKMLRHHPSPTIGIEVTLNDGKRNCPYCIACSLNQAGLLRTCYYVDR